MNGSSCPATAASEVIARVTSDDPDVRMPPADSKKPPLTPQEVELLRKWIDAGAKYEPHWSYIPPKRPLVPVGAASDSTELAEVRAALEPNSSTTGSPPRLGGPTWPRNEIDRFLLAKMQAQGIAPSAGSGSR